jgi:hypothetical protein
MRGDPRAASVSQQRINFDGVICIVIPGTARPVTYGAMDPAKRNLRSPTLDTECIGIDISYSESGFKCTRSVMTRRH